MEKEYYLGLDIGTGSVGFAVTDTEYNLCRKKGNDIWGIRLFEEGKTAVERRVFRSTRRRVQRRVQRIQLLQELLSSEICKVDSAFYHRLKESFFRLEDKAETQPNTLFNDAHFTDKDYHKDYHTIYHLRKALMENKGKMFDIRLIYLAIAHILKKRGHFLFEGQDISSKGSFAPVFSQFAITLYDLVEKNSDVEKNGDDSNRIDWTTGIEISTLEAILGERIGMREKQEKLFTLFNTKDKQERAFLKLLSGASVSLYDLFLIEELKEASKKNISVADAKYEENYEEYASLLGDKMACIKDAKAIYDWALLIHILGEKEYISDAKIESYAKHKSDLKKLKDLIKECCSKEVYNNMFVDTGIAKKSASDANSVESSKIVNHENGNDVDAIDNDIDKVNSKATKTPASMNYVAYIGKSSFSNNSSYCDVDTFYDFVKKTLKSIPQDALSCGYILDEIEKRTFMPRQSTGNNGVIPYQLHLKELQLILANASQHYTFLNEKDESGLSVAQKIEAIMTFRIPYYVGPLNDAHKKEGERSNCWIVRKEAGKVYPWNFENKVDMDKTAEQFIKQMTNKCTYLVGADVIPKNSILYSKFTVLNELNNLRINGDKIPVSLKQNIYNELFLKQKSVTQKRLKGYLEASGFLEKGGEISGIDEDFKSSMKPLLDMKAILQDKVDDHVLCENIINTLTLFGEEKKLISARLKSTYGNKLSDEEIKKLTTLRYSGWGRLSKEFLTEIMGMDNANGEVCNIITRLYETNQNLMHLLSSEYTYLAEIRNYNDTRNDVNTAFDYPSLVAPLYCSPAVKRGIWQSLSIAKEIHKIMGHEPSKVFIEVAREDGEKKKTQSRKYFLINLYKKCKDEVRDWVKELENKSDADLRSQKLYLYYTQMGKCMYSGDEITIDELFTSNIYDRDHIYPQSIVKDDSFDNLVLTKKSINSNTKKHFYPIPESLRTEKTKALWERLKKMGFISSEKYKRLTRVEEFNQDELAGFINRQLVETRQSSKAVAELLQKVFPKAKLVYSKAGNVSSFRHKFEFTKVRELNDHHHAEDAYLNIVVGNVFDTKFTNKPYEFLKEKTPYNLNRMYEYDVVRGKTVAWKTSAKEADKNNQENKNIQNNNTQAGANNTGSTSNTSNTSNMDNKNSAANTSNMSTIATVRNTMAKNRVLFTRYALEERGAFFKQKALKKGGGQVPLKGSDERLTIENYGGYNKESSAYFILVKHRVKNKEVRSIEFVSVRLAKDIKNKKLSLVDYCEKILELQEPIVLMLKIRRYTLFKINGFPMHLTGRMNKNLTFAPAVQLCVDNECKQHLKKVVKFNERNNKSPKKDCVIGEYDKISHEMNVKVYDTLLSKHKNNVYSLRPNPQIKTLEKGRDVFEALSLEKQCLVIYQILNLFKCFFGTADLKLINGVGQAGTVTKNKKLDIKENPRIISQSPTGMFTHEIDLFSL